MDNDTILDAEHAMTEAVKEMESRASAVALARQVVEFAGERKKSALSQLVVDHLNADCSGMEAEHRARADSLYGTACREIMAQTASAEEIITRYEIARHKFESARSILSVRRAQIGLT